MRLATDHGLQLPDESQVEEFVLDNFVQMYDSFESDRDSIPQNQMCDVRYEQLVADPVGQLQRVYEQLDLGDFDIARPHVEQHAIGMRDFQVNQYELTDQQRDRILVRWEDFCCRYGYWAERSRIRPTARLQQKMAG